MNEHFDSVAKIRDAVVVGELDTVAEHAEHLIASEDVAGYPEPWRPHVRELLQHADSLVNAASVAEAAGNAAALAGACGSCHVETAAKPNFGDTMEPAEDESLQAGMQRHQWAVEQLWEGIVAPTDEAWQRGASVFAAVPGCGEHFPDDERGAKKQRLCETVHALGRRAATAETASERIGVYGDFLGTCSGCHQTQ